MTILCSKLSPITSTHKDMQKFPANVSGIWTSDLEDYEWLGHRVCPPLLPSVRLSSKRKENQWSFTNAYEADQSTASGSQDVNCSLVNPRPMRVSAELPVIQRTFPSDSLQTYQQEGADAGSSSLRVTSGPWIKEKPCSPQSLNTNCPALDTKSMPVTAQGLQAKTFLWYLV